MCYLLSQSGNAGSDLKKSVLQRRDFEGSMARYSQNQHEKWLKPQIDMSNSPTEANTMSEKDNIVMKMAFRNRI